MKRAIQLLLAAELSLLALESNADWTFDFVRVTCVPEARYFRLEYAGVYGPAALTDAQHDDRKTRERLAIWRKHGYLAPGKLRYECQLPESKYRITATQSGWADRGSCGAAPEITLSLARNGAT